MSKAIEALQLVNDKEWADRFRLLGYSLREETCSPSQDQPDIAFHYITAKAVIPVSKRRRYGQSMFGINLKYPLEIAKTAEYHQKAMEELHKMLLPPATFLGWVLEKLLDLRWRLCNRG